MAVFTLYYLSSKKITALFFLFKVFQVPSSLAYHVNVAKPIVYVKSKKYIVNKPISLIIT